MYFVYSLILTVGFLILLPRFVYDAVTKGKYAAGFWERLGSLPEFDARGRKVVWLHCVSVGEVNAARPLAARIKHRFPDLALIVSTTTRTGQELARTAFADTADLIFYFPFDWRFTVRRALRHLSPSVVLLTETELWFNFIREADRRGIRTCLVNGRISERSFANYTKIRGLMKRVLGHLTLALMQTNADAQRLMMLGANATRVKVTGNLKFEGTAAANINLTDEIRARFAIDGERPTIVAASTHSPEEKWVVDAFAMLRRKVPEARLMLVPRHPERFEDVARLIQGSGFSWCRRSLTSRADASADVILLDTIGELTAVYPLADVVFVGGSLIPHGGQSILEPAGAARPIVTGAHTQNFTAAVETFLRADALVRLPSLTEGEVPRALAAAFADLLGDPRRRDQLGENALRVINEGGGAVERTLDHLAPYLG